MILAFAWTACAFAEAEPRKEPAPQTASSAKTASAAAGGSAIAPEDPEAARRLFRELDRNGGGCLTGEELWSERSRRANWAAVDRNRDGCISPDEFTVIRSP